MWRFFFIFLVFASSCEECAATSTALTDGSTATQKTVGIGSVTKMGSETFNMSLKTGSGFSYEKLTSSHYFLQIN